MGDGRESVAGGAIDTGRGVVQPWLCDMMGHLATQHYMAFYDTASFHLMQRLGQILIDDGVRRIGWADVRHEINYWAELSVGDLFEMRSGVVNLGRKSLSYRTYLVRLGDNVVCSTLDGTAVRFDMNERRATEVEDSIRSNAEHCMLA